MISEAYISGQAHQAIFKKEDEYYLFEPVDETHYRSSLIRLMDFNSFLLARPEIEYHKEINWTEEQLQTALKRHIAKHDALNLFLTGMDTTYSIKIRKQAMEILLEDYFSHTDAMVFVKNRVFGTSTPKQFDPISAAQIAAGRNNDELIKLYKDLSYSGDIIIAVRHAWKKAIIDDSSIRESDVALLDKVFTDEGIFAGFVTATLKHDGKAFDNVIITHLEKLSHFGISRPSLFLTTLVQQLLLATSTIFGHKREHYTEAISIAQERNYKLKKAILDRALELQYSNQWGDATAEMNELLDEWKKIGHVPRIHSDKMWEDFITARKNFFTRKDSNREQRRQYIEEQITARADKGIMRVLIREIKEEEEKIAEFKTAIENITPGKKADELRAHLMQLIVEGGENLRRLKERFFSRTQNDQNAAPEADPETAKFHATRRSSGLLP